MVLDDGSEAAFRGEYREVVPIERIVSMEVCGRCRPCWRSSSGQAGS
jgi:hypothetical protein